ncbi:MAG: phage tail sheath subtilisin-like domain-containing protein [Candidatus Syntrophopropionicum ammoniitolerans]
MQLDALYVGKRGNDFSVTVRDSLVDETKREVLIYEGVTLRQTIEFAKGDGGDGEPKSLAAAIATSNSPWVTAKVLSDGGNKLLATTATSAKFSGGDDPTVTGEDYSNGLQAIEALDWNVPCVDTDDAVIHAMVQTYIDRVRNEGKRVIGVVGEPTSETLATRLSHARAFNDPAIVYVANGFKGADGITREGYLAAARVAGMIAGSQVTDSLTHAVVRGATEVVGALTNAEIEAALSSGALVFTMSARKQVQIEQGINTFVTVTADMDAGWKKIRRVKTRDSLIDRITFTWDPLIGKINNSSDGRATLIALAQGTINKMVAEGALLGGIFAEDANNPRREIRPGSWPMWTTWTVRRRPILPLASALVLVVG